MRRLGIIFISTIILITKVHADEGMWLPYLMGTKNTEKMQELGCKLSPEQIFSFNQPSIKDAIAQFGRGCTGELISAEGLLLTNHHCAIGQVQAHSTIENDYLKNGFWAYSKAEELPNPGLTATFLIDVKDITSNIVKGVKTDLSGNLRKEKIEKNKQKYLDQIQKNNKQKVYKIVSFYYDNQYILYTYDVYQDVRLVACPPWGIGKFGADTDNWTWPRQKGDFCIFRVYTSPDGSPAAYAKENIPMKSKYFLPISIKGVAENDYTMIMGYPGSTNRYDPSQAVEMIINETGPAVIDCRTEKLKVFRIHSDASPEVFIKYASKQAAVSNYWKYCIGQVKQLQRNKVVEKRKELENQFAAWIKGNKDREKRYGTVLSNFENAYRTLSTYEKALIYHREAGFRGGEAIEFASLLRGVDSAIQKNAALNETHDLIKKVHNQAVTYFKDYDINTDKEVTSALFALFYKEIDPKMQPSFLQQEGNKNSGNFENYVSDLFENSIFTSQERYEDWEKKRSSIAEDPIFQVMLAFQISFEELRKKISEVQHISSDAHRLFMSGIIGDAP